MKESLLLPQVSLHIDGSRKITKSQPRNERMHQIAKKSAEIFKKSRKVVRETSSSVTAYYSRASAGECSTSQYLSPECPGEAREKPGQAQRRQGASPQKSKISSFFDPSGENRSVNYFVDFDARGLNRCFPRHHYI